MKNVMVYDVLGREIYKEYDINTKEFFIKEIKPSQQVLLIKIVLENGQILSKKIIF